MASSAPDAAAVAADARGGLPPCDVAAASGAGFPEGSSPAACSAVSPEGLAAAFHFHDIQAAPAKGTSPTTTNATSFRIASCPRESVRPLRIAIPTQERSCVEIELLLVLDLFAVL